MLLAIIKIKKVLRIKKIEIALLFPPNPRAPCLNIEAPTSYSEESANGAYSKKDKFR